MKDGTEIRKKIFYDNARAMGWDILSEGWPDFICRDLKTGEIICVEVKREADPNAPRGGPMTYRDPLRPAQKTVLSWLEGAGVRCYVSADGGIEPKDLHDVEEWPCASMQRGRPPLSNKPISRATKRQYGYKKIALENSLELARRTPEFPRDKIVELENRIKWMDQKMAEFDVLEEQMAREQDVAKAAETKQRADSAFKAGEKYYDALSQNLLDEIERYVTDARAKDAKEVVGRIVKEKEIAHLADDMKEKVDEATGGDRRREATQPPDGDVSAT